MTASSAERYAKIMALPLSYVSNEDFGCETEAKILSLTPECSGGPETTCCAEGLPAYLASLYKVPLLTQEQEAHLFRKMNYLKFRAAEMRGRVSKVGPDATGMIELIERYHQNAVAVRNEIVQANLRLVVSIARRVATPGADLFDLVSDGNEILLYTVDNFDYSRGVRFSTYATKALLSGIIRSHSREHLHRQQACTGCEAVLDTATSGETVDETSDETIDFRPIIAKLLQLLDDRQCQVITLRFGLGDNEPTIQQQIGKLLGISQQRVGQIEKVALGILRKAAKAMDLDPADVFPPDTGTAAAA